MAWWSRLLGTAAGFAVDESRWVVLDVETTGLDVMQARLLAIAALAVHFDRDGSPRIVLADSFEALLAHDGERTDKQNILVHGIGMAAQRAGAAPAAVLADFERWIDRSPLLAFHAGFDRAIIGRAMAEHLQRALPQPWLDLAPVAAALHPDARAHALDDWLARFGIVCAQRHQAASDTLATAELLLRLWPAATAQRCASLAGLTSLESQQRWLRS